MGPLQFSALVAVAVIVAVAWWWRRRRPDPVDDEWVLPPADSGPGFPALGGSGEERGSGAERGPVIDRDFLLRRDRTFDPSRWDNSPDAAPDDRGLVGGDATPAEDDLPRFLDREYLERRQREKDAGAS